MGEARPGGTVIGRSASWPPWAPTVLSSSVLLGAPLSLAALLPLQLSSDPALSAGPFSICIEHKGKC